MELWQDATAVDRLAYYRRFPARSECGEQYGDAVADLTSLSKTDIYDMLRRMLDAKDSRFTVTLSVEPEHLAPDYQNDAGEPDTEMYDLIQAGVDSGNPWAWCGVTVGVTFGTVDLRGEDYLGACSYDSEEDFKENSGYYHGLVDGALQDLAGKIHAAHSSIMDALCAQPVGKHHFDAE